MNEARVFVVARTAEGKCEIITSIAENNGRDRRHFLSEASPQKLRQIARQFLNVADEAEYG